MTATPSRAPSRRGLLRGGTAALALAGAGRSLAAGPALAASAPAPRAYDATTVPGTTARHYLNRLGCGFSRGAFGLLVEQGGPAAWLEAQLSPSSLREAGAATSAVGWFPDLAESPTTKWSRNVSGSKGGWQYAEDLANQSLLRRIYSRRQLLEHMVDFWSNHLHVHADHDTAWVYRASYDAMIRSHALGSFEDLLVAASLHPAMLLYLDTWTSVRGAPNENQGRELLELHTVGKTAGYTEQMVKDSAKLLSGYTLDAYGTWKPSYDPDRHTTGPVQVLDFSAANADADGRSLTVDYLRHLARHPATAANVARKLAVAFVADEPSTSLVQSIAQAFTDSGTDITAALRALVAHPDFYASRGTLVRTPIEDFVATCRVLQVAVQPPAAEDSFARTALYVPEDVELYQWPTPAGSPYGANAWASASRMLSSFRMHWSLAAGWWPTRDVTYRAPAAWLPQRSLRFDSYVDHLARVLLGRRSTSTMLAAALTATGCSPDEVIDQHHAVAQWMFVRLAGALLDSPYHLRH